MRRIYQIQEDINKTNALISEWERHLASDSAPSSIALNVRSLQKKCELLEAELLATAAEIGVDVCSYRIFTLDDSQPDIAPVSGALKTFQSAFTTIYDALTDRPKERASFRADTVQATALQFGYSFTGSAGFVLTVNDERLLFDDLETDLEAAIQTLFEIVASTQPENIGNFVPKVGHAGIRAVQSWVKSHTAAGLGADIEWHRKNRISAKLFKQYKEWRQLENAIDETGETFIDHITVEGELVAANLRNRTFIMQFQDSEDIKGSFDDAIGESHHAILPKYYRAELEKTTQVHYSLQENEVSYRLLRLEELE